MNSIWLKLGLVILLMGVMVTGYGGDCFVGDDDTSTGSSYYPWTPPPSTPQASITIVSASPSNNTVINIDENMSFSFTINYNYASLSDHDVGVIWLGHSTIKTAYNYYWDPLDIATCVKNAPPGGDEFGNLPAQGTITLSGSLLAQTVGMVDWVASGIKIRVGLRKGLPTTQTSSGNFFEKYIEYTYKRHLDDFYVHDYEDYFANNISLNGLWAKQIFTYENYCIFKAENVDTTPTGKLRLEVSAGPITDGGHIASVSSNYHYGSYRARIRTSGVPGVVNGFFYYLSNTSEIDIEFLSNEHSAHTVHFTNHGSSKSHLPVDLGFDPSLAYHEYGFDWYPDRVKFYVDGVCKGTIYQNVPSQPGYIMLNNWAGSPDWGVGPPDSSTTMWVDWVHYTPF